MSRRLGAIDLREMEWKCVTLAAAPARRGAARRQGHCAILNERWDAGMRLAAAAGKWSCGVRARHVLIYRFLGDD